MGVLLYNIGITDANSNPGDVTSTVLSVPGYCFGGGDYVRYTCNFNVISGETWSSLISEHSDIWDGQPYGITTGAFNRVFVSDIIDGEWSRILYVLDSDFTVTTTTLYCYEEDGDDVFTFVQPDTSIEYTESTVYVFSDGIHTFGYDYDSVESELLQYATRVNPNDIVDSNAIYLLQY